MSNTNNAPVQVETPEQEIARLKAEIAKLTATKAQGGMKVTEKGGLSIYGLGRFPITLYKSQWLKLLAMAEAIKAFIEANGDKLKDKAAGEVHGEAVKVA